MELTVRALNSPLSFLWTGCRFKGERRSRKPGGEERILGWIVFVSCAPQGSKWYLKCIVGAFAIKLQTRGDRKYWIIEILVPLHYVFSIPSVWGCWIGVWFAFDSWHLQYLSEFGWGRENWLQYWFNTASVPLCLWQIESSGFNTDSRPLQYPSVFAKGVEGPGFKSQRVLNEFLWFYLFLSFWTFSRIFD